MDRSRWRGGAQPGLATRGALAAKRSPDAARDMGPGAAEDHPATCRPFLVRRTHPRRVVPRARAHRPLGLGYSTERRAAAVDPLVQPAGLARLPLLAPRKRTCLRRRRAEPGR